MSRLRPPPLVRRSRDIPIGVLCFAPSSSRRVLVIAVRTAAGASAAFVVVASSGSVIGWRNTPNLSRMLRSFGICTRSRNSENGRPHHIILWCLQQQLLPWIFVAVPSGAQATLFFVFEEVVKIVFVVVIPTAAVVAPPRACARFRDSRVVFACAVGALLLAPRGVAFSSPASPASSAAASDGR